MLLLFAARARACAASQVHSKSDYYYYYHYRCLRLLTSDRDNRRLLRTVRHFLQSRIDLFLLTRLLIFARVGEPIHKRDNIVISYDDMPRKSARGLPRHCLASPLSIVVYFIVSSCARGDTGEEIMSEKESRRSRDS